MASHAGFLADILGHPDDDTPRLVYADWLEENGDPSRAEFIRLQCELAQLEEDDPRRWPLEQRQQAMLQQHKSRWLQEIQVWARRGALFQRGFVGGTACTANRFLQGAPGLFRRAPIQDVRLQEVDPARLKTMAGMPELSRARFLSMYHGLTTKGLKTLLGSPYLTGLRSLALWLGTAPATRSLLICSTSLAGMTRLELLNTAMSVSALAALETAPWWSRLETLRLWNQEIATEELSFLGRSALTSLRSLGLWGNEVNAAAIQELARLPLAPRLRMLNLDVNLRLTDEGVDTLAGSAAFSNLTTLQLQACAVGLPGVRALASSPHLTRLRWLRLNYIDLGDEGARILSEATSLGQLGRLELWGCNITRTGANLLARSPRLSGLTSLLIGTNQTGPIKTAALRERFGD